MLVLGIETTCDETAVAIVEDGKKILSNVIVSQTDLHAQYGGVFPELASRRHIDTIIPVLDRAFEEAKLSSEQIDLVAVAARPGLMGSLLIGVNAAKSLSMAWGVPFVGVNHVEAHLYAAMMSDAKLIFPSLGVVVSGGHTSLVLIRDIGEYEPIGATVDDAIGEAFDKVATLLGLSYPGGPEIEKLAKDGDMQKFAFSAGKVKEKPFHFSFSGLKTQVLYAAKGQNAKRTDAVKLAKQTKKDLAASFQYAACSDIVKKSLNAVEEYQLHAIYLGGGVTNNLFLKGLFAELAPPTLDLFWPQKLLTIDNAAMIAGLGYHVYQLKGADTLDLCPSPKIVGSVLCPH